MNSQNRMNAGAEYVLYRIWATLQDRDGIHAESLLACVGALAGYACQAYVRRAGTRSGGDARKFALTSVTAADGAADLEGDALNLPLIASPLSVWALVRRSLQKLGAPLPDVEVLSAHVTRTLGTSDFGVPRVDGGQRPRALPIVYLTQLWPQVLPIAQRFCRRPAQLPVLFGIALQRAIEHTTERLSPTLGASIAMECAIAMSKATLPATSSDVFQAPPAAPGITVPAGLNVASTAARGFAFASKPAASTSSGARARSSGSRASRRRRAAGVDTKVIETGGFRARMPSAKVVATLMSLAIVAVTSVAWRSERKEETPPIARVASTGLKAPAFRAADTASPFEPPLTFEQPVQQAQMDSEEAPAEDTPVVLQPSPDDTDLPAPTPDQGEGVIAEDWQSA